MNTSTAITEETMPKKEFQNVQLQAVDHRGGLRLALNNFAELEKFSHFMALSNFVPKHLRTKQADCLAVLLQSMRWEMDPFAVAQKTYFVNDGMAYEAQLVNAIVLSRAPLKGRPRLTWSGDGDDLKCNVSATFIGEDEPQEFQAEIKTITTKNSPLWKQQPRQQLAYFALRAWARLYCPDVLMGVYTKDEVEDASMHFGADNAINVTPEPKVIEDIEAGIKAEKGNAAEKKRPPHDPATGEILETAATQNQQAAVSEPVAETAKPVFDINQYRIDTQTGTKEAVKALCAVLEAYPAEERSGVWVSSGGVQILGVLGRHGIGSLRNKFSELGIKMPEAV